MLQPKKTKFRKAHKGRIKGIAKGGFTLNFGGFGLKALEPERVILLPDGTEDHFSPDHLELVELA